MRTLDAIHRPEYTGDDRCWPCTIVNAGIVLIASAVAVPVSGPLAFLVLVGGMALIYLRGYVVPGTPSFAPRLVTKAGLAPYFKHVGDDGPPERRSDELAENTDPERMLGAMFEAGVLSEGDDGDLYLTDEFETAWCEEMATLREVDEDALAAATAAVVPFDGDAEIRYDGVSVKGEEGVVWLRPIHAIADVAAVRAMREVGVPESVRAPGASPLRLFAPECPVCGGDVVQTTVADGCCGGTMSIHDTPNREVLACADCDSELHNFGPVGVDDQSTAGGND
ncbi:hypothetical protein [Halobaculum limi]|uniref:hypothetical protein n=1 Tax=Halobaculum limi TaxID=3031916 RepID=UPI0024064932|nr:hypothetical protein [Halobaculum sp. YSMS11]